MLQPAMSAALAIRDGVRDARQGTPPYLWSIIFDSGNRAAHIREGLRATSTTILLAVILDRVSDNGSRRFILAKRLLLALL
jgi:hypothetical protein